MLLVNAANPNGESRGAAVAPEARAAVSVAKRDGRRAGLENQHELVLFVVTERLVAARGHVAALVVMIRLAVCISDRVDFNGVVLARSKSGICVHQYITDGVVSIGFSSVCCCNQARQAVQVVINDVGQARGGATRINPIANAFEIGNPIESVAEVLTIAAAWPGGLQAREPP